VVSLPAGLVTKVAAAPTRVALIVTNGNRECLLVANAFTSGSLRRCLPQQPLP
jgi:hypothetical protein